MAYFFIICFALTLFFSLSLILKRGKTISEIIFVSWIVLLTITEISFFLHARGLFNDNLVFFSLICDTHVLHGVFFYLYVKSFTSPGFKIKPLHFLHVTPFFLMLGLKYYFNNVLGVMDCYGTGCLHEDNKYVDLLSLLKFSILTTYLASGWNVVHHYCHMQPANEGIDVVKRNWMYNITLGAILLFAFSSFYKVLSRLGFGIFGDDVVVVTVMVSFFVLVFLYLGNSYAYIFVSPLPGKAVNLDVNKKTANTESENRNQNTNEIKLKFDIIDGYVRREKPYLSGQFTLREISEKVNIPPTEVSLSIFNSTGKHYCDYMNAYRVAALKARLDDPSYDKYTILALALDCGFNSKTSFNRIFKQITGVTPSEYRMSLNRDSNISE